MTTSTRHTPANTHSAALDRDPREWKTGDEPATAAQRSYLETLAKEAGDHTVNADEDLTKAEAALKIEELQRRTGRGPTQQG